jgi:hypothetical protein
VTRQSSQAPYLVVTVIHNSNRKAGKQLNNGKATRQS